METSKKLKTVKTYLFYGWLGVVFLLSICCFNLPALLKISDKVFHFTLFFVFAFVSYLYFYDFMKSKKLVSVAVVLFSCAYGVLLEFMQYFIARTNFSKDDIIFNCVGALVLGIIVIPKRSITIYGRKV